MLATVMVETVLWNFVKSWRMTSSESVSPDSVLSLVLPNTGVWFSTQSVAFRPDLPVTQWVIHLSLLFLTLPLTMSST